MSVALPFNALLSVSASLTAAAEPRALQWQDWSGGLFEQAARESKSVLLDLEAVWCHWCHVMSENTYKDPEVVQLIQSRYIPLRVDQDARPNLTSRYEDYGSEVMPMLSSKFAEARCP